MPGIGQAPGHGRGNGAYRAHQGKHGNLALRQPMLTRQRHRHRRPVQAERREHQCLVQRALTQQRITAQQREQRQHQPGIAGLVLGPPLRQGQGQQQDDRQHDPGSADEHRTPAEVVSHQARQRPRQQDTQQQAAHDVADHPATLLLRRQVRRQRDKHLHRHRTEPDQQRIPQEQLALATAAGPRQQQADAGQHGGGHHQPAVFQQVGQRYQQ
ncbi:hypothetical protein D9M71_526630 [compost metagenome]